MPTVDVPAEHLDRILELTLKHLDNTYSLSSAEYTFLRQNTPPNFYCSCPVHCELRRRATERWKIQQKELRSAV